MQRSAAKGLDALNTEPWTRHPDFLVYLRSRTQCQLNSCGPSARETREALPAPPSTCSAARYINS